MRKLPNIVYILADDMGYGDVSCLNPDSKLNTVNIDAMARGGMRCTDMHSTSAVCTPSRYGILTGRYNWRSRLKSGVIGGYTEPLIEANRRTVADLMRGAGVTLPAAWASGTWVWTGRKSPVSVNRLTLPRWTAWTIPAPYTAARWITASTATSAYPRRWTCRPTYT